jgi:peptidylprolyl isomerase
VERQDPSKHAIYYQAFSNGLLTGDPASVVVSAPTLADSLFRPFGSLELLEEEYRRLAREGGVEGMNAILGALGQSGAPEVESLLREASVHSVRAVRLAATRALEALLGEEVPSSEEVGGPERTVDWEALAQLGPRPRLVLETDQGPVTLVLDTESAPLTVQTIAGLAMDGLYDGVPFHRVVPNFVVQGGDFSRQDGFGGPGFAIRSEFTLLPYRRGVLGMASSGKDTEGSQFFITHSRQPHLDGAYTSFGWVEEGMDIVDSLYEEHRILSARIEPGTS